MALNEMGYSIISLPPINQKLKESFRNLVLDQYMGNGNRYRRFSQYKLYCMAGRWNFELLPHRPYMTFSKFNKVAGGIKRIYQPLEVDFTKHIEVAALSIPLDTKDEWQINVHQYRVLTGPNLVGVTVPEGPHQDGHDYVMIAVIKRSGITGAEMSLMPIGGEGKEFFKVIVNEGQAALLNDRDMFHYVTDIVAIENEGYRDIFVVAFSRWDDRWHGDEFEKRVASTELSAI